MPHPGHFTPEKGKWYRRLSGDWGDWAGAENLAPMGFNSWTAQPAASCYTSPYMENNTPLTYTF
jgi:hypothetical protein